MIEKIKILLEENGDREQAEKMSTYMKNKFEFAGIPKPKLKELIKPLLKETSKQPIDWNMVLALWDMEQREAQYIALEYLLKHRKQVLPEDITHLKTLITNKSWWETVDTIDVFVGDIVLKDAKLKDIMMEWAVSDNIWLRRVAIDHQQEYKLLTDEELLSRIILLNLGSEEFFINKAIGWSLRDYSKVKPEWVKQFIADHGEKMSGLSVKEASKYIL